MDIKAITIHLHTNESNWCSPLVHHTLTPFGIKEKITTIATDLVLMMLFSKRSPVFTVSEETEVYNNTHTSYLPLLS